MSRNLFDPNVIRSIQANLSKNCLSYWFPILEKTGVRVPETVIIKTEVELGHLLDGVTPKGFDGFIQQLVRAAFIISGEYHLRTGQFLQTYFLRTGMLSGKHSWLDTCYVPFVKDFPEHVAALVEESAVCDMLGRPFDVWAVREFIPMVSAFTAFNGLPINKERRYFIKDGEVICHHPYWPQEAVAQGGPKDSGDGFPWQERLAYLNVEPADEVAFLSEQARIVSRVFEGAWSLDFSQARTGEWLAIDMAVAEESYHWEDCPNNVNVTNGD